MIDKSTLSLSFILFKESGSPVDKPLDSRNSEFDPAVNNREKLDFNKNLKEGKKDDSQPLCLMWHSHLFPFWEEIIVLSFYSMS